MIHKIPNSVIISKILPKLDYKDKLALSQSCQVLRNLVEKKTLYKTLWVNLWEKTHNYIVEFNNDFNKNEQFHKNSLKVCIIMILDDFFVFIDYFRFNDYILCPYAKLYMKISYTKDSILKSFEINIDDNFNLQEMKVFPIKLYDITMKNTHVIYSLKNMIYMLNEIRIIYNSL